MTNKQKREFIWRKYDECCAYCGKLLEYQEMQVDHFIPEKQGKRRGIDVDDMDNLMPSCRRCNHYKRSNSLEKFRQLLKTIHIRIQDIYIVKVAMDYCIVDFAPFSGEFWFEYYNKSARK